MSREFKNPFIEERRKNIQILKELIREKGSIKHSKVIALMGIYGITEKTVASYLKTLQDSEFIVYNGENNTWKIKE